MNMKKNGNDDDEELMMEKKTREWRGDLRVTWSVVGS
jgi:hypothetical protein